MMGHILGIDLGTSGVKAGMLNLASMKLECISARSYDDSPEQDPDVLWQCAVDAVRESVDQLGSQKDVKAIGLSGQMHGAVLYDVKDNLLGPINNWKDEKRSNPAVVEKIKLVMSNRNYTGLGTEISSGFSAAILFGIKENDPQLFRQIAHFMLPTDFLRGKLLGHNDYATDPTNAFGTGLLDVKFNQWDVDLITDLQLPLSIFPEIHSTSQKAGIISDNAAQLLGLKQGIPIIYGGGDNQMSMLGSGLVSADSPLLVNVGTAAQISKVMSTFIKYPGLDTRSYFNGSFAIVGASLAGGGSYKWLRQQIWELDGRDFYYDELNKLAAIAPPGANGLVFCSGPTRQDPDRKFGFYGNKVLSTSIAHKARAVMEGVLMDLYDAYEILAKNVPSNFIAGAGKGLQKSQAWSQITADFFGKPLRITQFENAVFGASLLAALSVDGITNLLQAVQSIKYAPEIIPDETESSFYREEFVPYWRTIVKSERSNY